MLFFIIITREKKKVNRIKEKVSIVEFFAP